MTTARPWKKWLKVGKWWLRRRIKSISSQPIVFRQPRYALFCQTKPHVCHVSQRSPHLLIFGPAR
jgi:hypothetical protein